MKPQDVLDYYGNGYRFKKATGMSDRSLVNWIRWGFIPEGSQHKIERLSNGALKTEWTKKG
ncbi:MAG TPA: Cro/CI family transcriptional regulator [Rummeliibacillus sp.]|nr:Cro/CI family transcriptional regulator [Rummeliibacillus sp.]